MKYTETAKRLSDAMNKKNIKAAELATITGVNKASISQYINGKNAPGNISAFKLSKVLDVSPQWLMGFDVDIDKEMDSDAYQELANEIYLMNEAAANQAKIDLQNEAMKFYSAYLAAPKKTRRIIYQLLDLDEEE